MIGRRSRGIAAWIGLSVVIIAALAAYGIVRFGSLRSSLAYVRNDLLIVEGGVKVLGDLPLDSRHDLQFSIRNLGGRSVRILGAKSSCTCATIGERPREIPPGESRSVLVRFHVEDEGPVGGRVTLFTDDPAHRELPLILTARGLAPAPPSPIQPKASEPRL